MTLLSPLALLFGLAALVPLILHLYQRRNRTIVLFSTTRFFNAAVLRSQRRLQLRRLLLLLLRVAACLLLALALARPLLSWGGVGAAAPGTRDLLILLDDSLSMRARDTRRMRFDDARKLAADAVRGLAPGDRAAVITFAGRTLGHVTRAGLEPSPDRARLVDEIEQLEPTLAAGDATAALHAAARMFEHAARRTRLMLVLSDFQESDWQRGPWPQSLHPVATALINLGPPADDNITVESVVLSQGTAVAGQPNLMRVRIINHRHDTCTADLVLSVNDLEHARRPIELVGQSPRVERLPITFEKPGLQRVVVRVEARDRLRADDSIYAVVRVSDRLPVLIVNGDSDGPRDRSGAFYLGAALRAASADGESMQPDLISPDDLPGATLEAYRVIALSNVAGLPAGQLERLERFVQAGGGLAIFLGNRADQRFYNDAVASPARPFGGLMPGTLRSRVGAEGALPLHILEADLDHPVLQRFAGTLRGALAGVNVYRAHVVRPRNAWVIARLEQDVPLILERAFGRGRVMLFTTPPQPDWTDLPLRGVFIPLVTRAVSYLADSTTADHTAETGRPLTVFAGPWDYNQPLYVFPPGGGRLVADIQVRAGQPTATIAGDLVNQAGFYRVQPPDNTSATLLAVNTPRRESTPDALDIDKLEDVAGRWSLLPVSAETRDARTPADILAPLIASRASGRGVWDILLWTTLILILAEPLIANRRVRQTSATTDGRAAA